VRAQNPAYRPALPPEQKNAGVEWSTPAFFFGAQVQYVRLIA
jgi:hypothetical protein